MFLLLCCLFFLNFFCRNGAGLTFLKMARKAEGAKIVSLTRVAIVMLEFSRTRAPHEWLGIGSLGLPQLSVARGSD